MREEKKKLRAAVRAGSRPYGGETDIADRIEALPQFASARTVALYHALPGEPSTAEILRRHHASKCLALPVITGPGEMVFREYTAPDDLTEGAFGIREPKTGREIPPEEIDLMLVPGLAFDNKGRRLGRGKGFYDRYLSHPDAAHIFKAGICPAGARVPAVPAEPHDVAMDVVITNEKIVNCRL